MRKHLLVILVLLLLGTLSAIAQEVVVTGKVISAQNEPLPAVSVTIKGSSKGTSTDANGSFTIKVPTKSTLVFSYIGFTPREVTVNEQTTVNVTLKEDIQNLEQVVVVGYGTQTKKNITGSVSTIGAKEIAERPITNAAQAIQGKAAGVQVVSPSGKPGQALSVRIRGANSISAGNEPLYVVDGVPTTDISSVNPADIENMTILKDASSAAIYGSRAANGVVLVNTKKGDDKMKVGFNMYLGASNPTNKMDALNAKQYQQLMNEVLGEGTVTNDEVNKNINWNDEVFRTGLEKNYQLTLSHSTNKLRQYYSAGYTDQTGMIKPSYFKKISARSNLDYKATKWLNLGTNLSFSNNVTRDVTDNASSARGGVVLAALTTPSIVPKYTEEGWIAVNPRSGWHNPLSAIEGSEAQNRNNRFLGNLSAEVKITPDLKFKSLVGLDYSDGYNYTVLDPFLTRDGRQDTGRVNITKAKEKTWLTEQTLAYDKKVGAHNFSVLGGFTTQTHGWEAMYTNTSKFGRDTAAAGVDYILSHHRGLLTNTPDSLKQWALISGLARITYDYDGRYLFTGNIRSDASSKFRKEKRTGIFPSFSAGWRISSEKFFTNVKAVQELKLRAGWGMTGNQEGIKEYDYMKRYRINPIDGSQTLVNFANPSLTWEKTTATNVGLDFTFLASRITVNADWYYKKTTDVLVRMRIPNTAGLDEITMNTGDLENKGVEFNISSKNITTGNWRWNTDFNIAFNKNKILRVGNDPNLQIPAGEIYQRGDVSRIMAGHELGAFFGYIAKNVNPMTGDMIYADLNHNGVTGAADPGDRTFIGSAQPKFIYGFTNTVSYKKLDLSVFFQGSQGNQIFNGARIETEGMYDSRNQSSKVLNRWTQPGEITDVPRALKDDTHNSLISTRFLEDGSYLRLKSLTLAYRLGGLKRLGISNTSMYVTGNNILTFTKYTGFDPEVNSYGNDQNSNAKNIGMGIDYGAYPQTKSFIVGLNVSF